MQPTELLLQNAFPENDNFESIKLDPTSTEIALLAEQRRQRINRYAEEEFFSSPFQLCKQRVFTAVWFFTGMVVGNLAGAAITEMASRESTNTNHLAAIYFAIATFGIAASLSFSYIGLRLGHCNSCFAKDDFLDLSSVGSIDGRRES